MTDMGMGNVNAAMMSAVFPLAGCLGTIALGYYTDHYAPKNRMSAMWVMLVGLVIALAWIAMLVPSRLEHTTMIVALLGLGGFCLYGPYSMSAGCLSLDIAGPDGAGTCTGLIDGIGYIGGAVAAWGAGVIADQFGWSEVFWSLAGLGVFTVGWVYYMSWFAQRNLKI